MTPRARLDVLEVEAEDIVPLDDVGIALADEPRALGEQLRLRHLRSRQDGGEAGRVGERDGDDAVRFPRRVRELEAGRRRHLDVQRQAMQVAEAHAEEGGLAGAEEELVDGVVKKR